MMSKKVPTCLYIDKIVSETTSKPENHLGIIAYSKRKSITSEIPHPPTTPGEVVVADLPEPTTTSKQPFTPFTC